MNIENALRHLVPDPIFYGPLFTQEDYENGIQWADPRPKPYWREIVVADQELQALAAAKAKTEADAAIKEEAARQLDLQAKAALPGFGALTPAQIENRIETEVTDLKTAKNLLKKMAIAISILERRL